MKVKITYLFQPQYSYPFWAYGVSDTGIKHSCCSKSFEDAKKDLCDFYQNFLKKVPVPEPEEIDIKDNNDTYLWHIFYSIYK